MGKYAFEPSQEVKTLNEYVGRALEGCDDIYALILMGSCARGEESYYFDDSGKKRLLSDYEAILVKNKDLSKETKDKLNNLKAALSEMTQSPFFDFEYTVYSKPRLRVMDKRFIHYEAWAGGCLIYGNPGVFDLFPKISIKNLNFSELNSIVIHRYYHVFKDWNRVSERQRKYLIARNTLDIPSLVLPHMGLLIPSYKLRLAKFRECLPEGFDDAFCERLANCLSMKLDFSSDLYERTDSGEMLEQFICDFDAAESFVRSRQNGELFLADSRMVLAGILKLDCGKLLRGLRKADLEESLLKEMKRFLCAGDYSEKDVLDIANRIEVLYGYK